MIDKTFVEAISALALDSKAINLIPQTLEGAKAPFIVVNGLTFTLESFLDAPLRIKTHQTFISRDSFAEYVNRFKAEATLIFGSLAEAKFTSVLDYHGPAPDPSWCDHKASLQLQRTPDWIAWTQRNSKSMSQVEFAEFLEDMAHTVEAPDAASIVETVLRLQATTDVSFESVVDRDTGSATFAYREDTKQTTSSMKLPTQIEIVVAPFRTAMPIQLLVRLRYRLREGKLTLHYNLLRADRVEEEAFNEVAAAIEKATSIKPLLTQ